MAKGILESIPEDNAGSHSGMRVQCIQAEGEKKNIKPNSRPESVMYLA